VRILFFYGWKTGIQGFGGAQISVVALAEGLARAGHSVGIADIQQECSTKRSLGSLQIPYWSVSNPCTRKGLRSSSWARGTWQTLALLREFRPDIVSVQSPVFQSPLVVAASWLPHRWRLAVTVRGSDVRQVPPNPVLRPWQNRLLGKADAMIVVSQSLLPDIVQFGHSVREKAQVIPNAVDPSWFERPALEAVEEERHILFVGRFHVIKGVDILLRAWSLLQRQAPNITLWLVGAGRELESLMSLSEQLGISKSVRFKGSKTQAELHTLYRRARVVVLPSRNEGLPRVALEAGACGAICVATRAGGTPEVIQDEITGFLVDPESPEALAQGMLRALRLPEPERQRMSAAAQAHIQQHFRQETIVARYQQVFQSVLHDRTEQVTSY
jgi:glycosyltransferase involved in cell wall biosynthesis